MNDAPTKLNNPRAAAMAPTIFGPPVANHPQPTAPWRPPRKTYSASDSDGFSSDEDSPSPKEKAVHLGRSLAYASSGEPCVDFFFQVVPGATSAADVSALLAVAWARDSLTTLKLVCHLRGVRGLGKADRESFYAAALWLHERHPKTLAGNLATFAKFGCLKDLPELLYRILHGPRGDAGDTNVRRRTNKRRCMDKISAEARLQAEAQLARITLSRYAADERFRFLYDRVADFFAQLLKSDLEYLDTGDTAKIGLAAKWCPSLRSSYDRATLLCEAIARRIFPREWNQEYLNLSDEHYTYRVRDRLRREVLVPLRKVLELPEVYMSAGQWDELPYERVASVAMRQYKKAFVKRNESRVANFFHEVRTGEAKIQVDGLLPHEIIARALVGEDDEVAELQWRGMVSALAAKGHLTNCIAVCGVSKGIDEAPVVAALALGLLISELSEEPWKGRLITFDATQQLHKVRGVTLKEKLRSLAALKAKMGANLQSVFDQIINIAVDGGLAKDKMVKRVFVFSDMEFYGGGEVWETDYEAITRKFAEARYGEVVPEIVFWNVGASKARMPAVSAQKGVALVSGFSKNLVKLFLESDGELTPAAVMAEAISGPEYDGLEVFD